MKIQPINDLVDELESMPVVLAVTEVVKPVVRSRLRRLFRITGSEKDEQRPPAAVEAVEETEAVEFEPSSVCLAKMVRNFIEENNEKQTTSVKCGRNRCNCFNGNGSDGSDGEADAVVVRDYLKRLVINTSVNERKLKGETERVVAEKSKGCKRKEEVRKVVMEGLMAVGYDAAICKSKWDQSSSFPAGEYEYVDVIVGGERLIIDIDFRSEFEVARSTKTYKSILQILPNVFVGKSDRLSKIICIVSEAAKQSLKKKGMHVPPWRKANYVQAKWLSPPNRLITNSSISTPTAGPHVQNPVPDEPEASNTTLTSTQPETVFDMSESSNEAKRDRFFISPKKNSKIVSALSSIIEEKP